MRNNDMKKAFTLIELLTVVIIIGLISSAALVMLKDTGEVKALQYTKKVMRAMKNAVAEKEDKVFTGFLNDFGTMPPNTYFLLNIEKDASFVAKLGNDDTEELGKFKIKNFKKYNRSNHNDRIIPMPFMDTVSGTIYTDTDVNITDENGSILYIGYHGGYIGMGVDGRDKTRSIKDGWSSVVEFVVELNATIAYNTNKYLTIRSLGSDGVEDNNDSQYLVKKEFNEYFDDNTIKSAYKDDINMSYRYNYFGPKRLESDVNSSRSYVIYSPMIYYVKGSNDLNCTEYSHRQAECPNGSGNYKDYVAYNFEINVSDLKNLDLSWHVGVIKYKLLTNKIEVNDEHNITLDTTSIDFTEKFYINAGEKKIIRLDDNLSYMKLFMPNEPIDIKYKP